MYKFIHSLNDDLYEKAQLMDAIDEAQGEFPFESVIFLKSQKKF